MRHLTQPRVIGLIALVAVAIRLAILVLPLPLPLSNDDAVYQRIGLSLLRGEGFRDPLFYSVGEPFTERPPLLPHLLALLYGLFGYPHTAPHVLFAALGGVTVLATWWLGRPIFGSRAALLAALLAAFYPMSILLTAYTLTENLSAPLTLLGAGLVLRVARGQRFIWAPLAGLCLGIGLLNRSDGLVLLVGGVAFILAAGRAPVRRRLTSVAVMGLLAGLVVAPWSLRNYLESGRLVVVDTVFFPAFYLGNNPDTRQALLWELETGRRGSVLGPRADEPLIGLPSPARHAREWELAWDHILSHPLETVEVTFFKFQLFWRPYPHPLDATSTLVLECIALFGLWSETRGWRHWWPLLLLVILFAMAHAVASSLPRNRLTVMPLVLLFSAAGLQAGLDWLATAWPGRAPPVTG